MSEEQRKPLILVVDDVPKYRQELLPAMAESLGCRSISAGTVAEAVRIAADRGFGSDDPVDLAILDMHMPCDDESRDVICEDAGTRCLQAMTQFSYLRLKFPCVVFTAFPSFKDCVAATKAGADAYIPKSSTGKEGGPKALRETCRALLFRHESATEVPPTRAWIERNHAWLTAEFDGMWVAFVPNEVLEGDDALGAPERDGVVLLSGESYEDVRAKVLKSPSVLRAQPAILMVRGKRGTSREAKE